MTSNVRSILRIAVCTFAANMLAFAGFITGTLAAQDQQPAPQVVQAATIVKVEKVPDVAYIIHRTKGDDGRWYFSVWSSPDAKILTGRAQDSHPCKALKLDKAYAVKHYGVRLLNLNNGPCFLLLQQEEFFLKPVKRPSLPKPAPKLAEWTGTAWFCDSGYMVWASEDLARKGVEPFVYCLPEAGFTDLKSTVVKDNASGKQ